MLMYNLNQIIVNETCDVVYKSIIPERSSERMHIYLIGRQKTRSVRSRETATKTYPEH